MLKRLFLSIITLAIYLNADASFITPLEYATSLYENPRGIGCNKCHGNKGEGLIVAKYQEKDKQEKLQTIEFGGPKINNKSFDDFYYALNRRIKGMPRYFLTQSEIQSLYYYLQEKSEQKKDDK